MNLKELQLFERGVICPSKLLSQRVEIVETLIEASDAISSAMELIVEPDTDPAVPENWQQKLLNKLAQPVSVCLEDSNYSIVFFKPSIEADGEVKVDFATSVRVKLEVKADEDHRTFNNEDFFLAYGTVAVGCSDDQTLSVIESCSSINTQADPEHPIEVTRASLGTALGNTSNQIGSYLKLMVGKL